MQTKINYAVIGLFVIILLGAIITIGSWLSFGLKRQPYKTYVTYMNESVAGLEGQALVKYNGVDVGYVSEIKLNYRNPQQVIIYMKIKQNTPISEGTKAMLMEQGLTGIAYIELRGGINDKPLTVTTGHRYPIIRSAPSFFLQLDTTVQTLSNNIQSLTISMQKLLDKQNLQSIKQTLSNLDKVTTTISANSQQLDHSMKSLNVLLTNGAAASKNLPEVIQQLQKTSININKTMKQGNIAIEAFSNQILPKAYNTLQNIQSASSHIQGLSSELENNPAAILQGSQPRAYGPGEN